MPKEELPEVAEIHSLPGDLEQVWNGGPFGEPARAPLKNHRDLIGGWVDTYRTVAREVERSGDGLVITHGQPPGGNLIRTAGSLFLIDWDTVALAPRERDLWMLDDGSPGGFAPYTEVTGRTVNRSALQLYRLAWTLSDVAGFFTTFRHEHERNEDTDLGWRALTHTVAQDGS